VTRKKKTVAAIIYQNMMQETIFQFELECELMHSTIVTLSHVQVALFSAVNKVSRFHLRGV